MFPIPANATRIRYVQANGIAYIDTGVPFTTDYTARCKFQFVSASSENLSPFGFWYASQVSGGTQMAARMYWRGGSSDWRFQYPTTSATVFASGSSMPFADVHELEIGPSGVKMDGTVVSVSAASWSDASYTQSLFGAQSYDPYIHAIKHEMRVLHHPHLLGIVDGRKRQPRPRLRAYSRRADSVYVRPGDRNPFREAGRRNIHSRPGHVRAGRRADEDDGDGGEEEGCGVAL